MKINWKIRVKDPRFWVAIVCAILSAAHINIEEITTWGALGNAFMDIIRNPFTLVTAAVAIAGIVRDPTTQGMSDSLQALGYTEPKSDGE